MKNQNGSIGVLICIIIIILLSFAVAFMYVYFNYFEVKPANIRIEALEEKIKKQTKTNSGTQDEANNQGNNFNNIYNTIRENGLSYGFDFVISSSGIKEVTVDEIRIYNPVFCEVNGIQINKSSNANLVYGACTITIEFEDIATVQVTENVGVRSGNCLVVSKYFIYNQASKLIELRNNL